MFRRWYLTCECRHSEMAAGKGRTRTPPPNSTERLREGRRRQVNRHAQSSAAPRILASEIDSRAGAVIQRGSNYEDHR